MYSCHSMTGNDNSIGKQLAFTRPFEWLVAQRTMRLTTNQEITGSNPAKLADRLFTPKFLVFGDTEQDYPVDRHQRNSAETKRKNH